MVLGHSQCQVQGVPPSPALEQTSDGRNVDTASIKGTKMPLSKTLERVAYYASDRINYSPNKAHSLNNRGGLHSIYIKGKKMVATGISKWPVHVRMFLKGRT